MSWRVVLRPEVESDIVRAAAWYNANQPGLGEQFRIAVVGCLEALTDNPLLGCRRHPTQDIRWRYPDRFPYRVVYRVDEQARSVVVAAVLHAARQDRHWKSRLP